MKTMKQGFTLVEIMIVVAIIAILAAIAIPNFVKYRKESQEASCASTRAQIVTAAENWGSRQLMRNSNRLRFRCSLQRMVPATSRLNRSVLMAEPLRSLRILLLVHGSAVAVSILRRLIQITTAAITTAASNNLPDMSKHGKGRRLAVPFLLSCPACRRGHRTLGRGADTSPPEVSDASLPQVVGKASGIGSSLFLPVCLL